VSAWARANGLSADGKSERHGAVIRAVNAVLEVRYAVGALSEVERASLADLVV
jgi:hypothetical protein